MPAAPKTATAPLSAREGENADDFELALARAPIDEHALSSDEVAELAARLAVDPGNGAMTSEVFAEIARRAKLEE